jgi:hypothetical protein
MLDLMSLCERPSGAGIRFPYQEYVLPFHATTVYMWRDSPYHSANVFVLMNYWTRCSALSAMGIVGPLLGTLQVSSIVVPCIKYRGRYFEQILSCLDPESAKQRNSRGTEPEYHESQHTVHPV